MNLVDLLLTASASMWRSKVRTFLTVIAIFIGAMTITLTNGIGTGIKGYLNRQIGNLGATNVLSVQLQNKNASGPGSATNPPSPYNPNVRTASSQFRGEKQLLMTAKDLSTIKSTPNIINASPEHLYSPDYIMGKNGKYQMTLQQQYGATTADMLAGHGVENNSSANQLSIPYTYLSVLGYASSQSAIGQKVTIGITSAEGVQSEVQATIAGVQQKTVIGNDSTFANASLANKLYAIQSNGLPPATANSFSVIEATFPSSFTPTQITDLKNSLSQKGYSSQTIKDQENAVFMAINVVIIVFDMFGVIALLAASFGIINTLFMAVQERTKEIGLMKALGMSPRRIFTLFSIEAVLIGFWGSILGVAFAIIVGNLINDIGRHGFLKDFPGLSLLTFPFSTLAIVVGAIMIIAFLAGTLPALRASKKDPIDALRYE